MATKKQERFFHTAAGKAKLGAPKAITSDGVVDAKIPGFAKPAVPAKPLAGRRFRDIGGRRGVK